jgi:hypothetical protein
MLDDSLPLGDLHNSQNNPPPARPKIAGRSWSTEESERGNAAANEGASHGGGEIACSCVPPSLPASPSSLSEDSPRSGSEPPRIGEPPSTVTVNSPCGNGPKRNPGSSHHRGLRRPDRPRRFVAVRSGSPDNTFLEPPGRLSPLSLQRSLSTQEKRPRLTCQLLAGACRSGSSPVEPNGNLLQRHKALSDGPVHRRQERFDLLPRVDDLQHDRQVL